MLSQSQSRTLPVMVYQIHGSQYTSQEFSNFAKSYGFKLITRSPYYARATGKAEAAVKEAKKMLKNQTSSLVSWTIGTLRLAV